MKFRKKTVVIEAVQFDGSQASKDRILILGARFQITLDGIAIRTLEGTMLASEGDWIIKGIAGEFYPCKPDIFEKTYEPVVCENKEGENGN